MQQLVKSCFRGIPTDNAVIVAVSGGSDSMALLLLANAWAIEHKVHLQAITIDHGLRPEAAAEAAFVASVCSGIGVDHVTLAWEGVKPAFGIQSAARKSRYSLLDQFAHDIGVDIIMTGHTLDDQAETVYMRNQRHTNDSDGKGMSGMARRTWLYGGRQIYRPLLGVSRATLRKTLKDFSQSWIEDPTNMDESYERVKTRNILLEKPEVAIKHLALANVCGRFREAKARDTAAFLHSHTNLEQGSVFYLDLKEFLDTGEPAKNIHPVVLHAIQLLICISGGQQHLTARHRLSALLDELIDKKTKRVNIGGSIIELIGNKLRFYRESRNLGPLVLEPGDSAIWDGRTFIHNETPTTVFVEAAKKSQICEYERLRGEAYKVMPRQALLSTPVIHTQVESVEKSKGPILPMVDMSDLPNGLHVRLASPAIEHFCPQFDAPLRNWIMSIDRFSIASIAPK